MDYAVLFMVFLIPGSYAYCDLFGARANPLITESNGTRVWTDGSPAIELKLQVEMPSMDQHSMSFIELHLLQTNETIFNAPSIGYLSDRGKYVRCRPLKRRIELSCQQRKCGENFLEVYITILNITSDDDLKTLVLSFHGNIMFERQLHVRKCSIESIPSNLQDVSALSRNYSFGETLEVTCRTNEFSLLLNNSHSVTMNITCGQHIKWNGTSDLCDPGTVVDFNAPKVTLNSGQSVVFSCKSTDSETKVRLELGPDTVTAKEHAWMNITLTSQYHGVAASCDEINESGEVQLRRAIDLNVLYPPEVKKEDKVTKFELLLDTSGRVVVDFRANPAVQQGNIRITKNRSRISNYYTIIDGVNHRAVVDFLKVKNTDLGDYVMTVTSYSPGRLLKLVQNFTIEEGFPKSQPLSTLVVSAIAACATAALCVITFVAIIVIKKGCRREEATIKKTPDVRYRANDSHNYEVFNVRNQAAATQGSQDRVYANADVNMVDESIYEYDN